MPYYLSIAFKNIFRDPRRSFTLGINYLFVALLLFLVFSITGGMKKNITRNVVASTAGHITISGETIVNGRTYQGIKGYQRIERVVREYFPEARVLTRYALSSAVYYQNLSKRLSFTGIDVATDRGLRDQITLAGGVWDEFAAQTNGVIIPRKVADYFGLKAGDEVLVSARSRFGAFNTATIQVKGIYTTGNYFLRELVISHFGFLRKLDLADSTIASKMYLFFRNTARTADNRDLLLKKLDGSGFVAIRPASGNDALNAVAAASPRYRVQDSTINQVRLTLATADEVTGIVSQAVAAINGGGLFIAAIMLFIISVSIFINMRMTINERLQEIGTLRAIGAEQGDIIRLFVAENVLLSLLFSAAGIVAALVVASLFSTVITVPSDGILGLFVNRSRFVLQPTLAAAALITAALVLFTVLFSFFPARRGGMIPPVVALNKTN
ncbi:MAG: FtsX-like permease family protein [Chitinispirillaceae bacterium]|nr:FtsX-like permease family protein [Chitinispirillaceae bacterium]